MSEDPATFINESSQSHRRTALLWAAIAGIVLGMLVSMVWLAVEVTNQQEAGHQRQTAIDNLSHDSTALRQALKDKGFNPNTIAPPPSERTGSLPPVQGPQGVPGIPGLQGPAGPQGPAGLQGVQGVQGAQGVAGEACKPANPSCVGPPGATGAAGEPGATGAKGDKGDPGSVGETGPAGPPGPAGPSGPAGPAGENGLKPVEMTCTNDAPPLPGSTWTCTVTKWG
jgi:hypothetical protein